MLIGSVRSWTPTLPASSRTSRRRKITGGTRASTRQSYSPEFGRPAASVVQGPLGDQIVRRKTRVGVIWLNTDQMRFRNVPAFYAAAASRPLDEIARPAVLQRHGIGIGNLRIRAATSQQGDPAREAEFLAALVRNKQRQGLYAREVGEVSFLGRSLFRTRLAFPANVPPGSYQVQVFQLRDRGVTSAQSSPLGISKIGLEADLFDLAHRLSALYGLGSILLASLAGWAGYAMFRKR